MRARSIAVACLTALLASSAYSRDSGIYRNGERIDGLNAPGLTTMLDSTAATHPNAAGPSVTAQLSLDRERIFTRYHDELASLSESLSGAASSNGRKEKSALTHARASLPGLLDEVLELMERTEAYLLAVGLPNEIQERHVQTVAAVVDEVMGLQVDLEDALAGSAEAVQLIRDRLAPYAASRQPGPIGDAGPSSRVRHPPAPRIVTVYAIPAAPKNDREAAQGRSVPAPPPGAPGPEFLAQTLEIQFTPEITQLAADLDNDPIAIFEYVRNNVDVQVYTGSRKGAAETLRQLKGNDTDQASLLMALLRVSGIPCRYVQGNASTPVERFISWYGSTNIEFVAAVMSADGMAGTIVNNGMGDPIAVNKTHLWVEAYLPYAGYRGTQTQGPAQTWIPLDASFSMQDIDNGQDVVDLLDFSVNDFFDSYISTFTTLSPNDRFEADIQTWLDANQPGEIIADVERTTVPIPQSLGLIPASLPFDVLNINARFPELFETQRYKVRFALFGVPGTLLDHTVDLVSLVGKHVLLEYVGATPGDQATIDSFGGLLTTPPNLVQLVPRLVVGGQVLATGTTPIGMGLDVSIELHFTPPSGGVGADPMNAYLGTAGSNEAYSFNPYLDKPADDSFAFATSPTYLVNVMLQSAVAGYQSRRGVGEEQLHRLIGAFAQFDVRPNRAISEVFVGLSGMTPVSFTWQALGVDINERNKYVGDAVIRTGLAFQSFIRLYAVLDGLHASYLEHNVLEEVFERDAVSTVKILQLANDAGIPICTITNTVGFDCPGFSHPAAVLNEVNTKLLLGREVIIPRDPLTVEEWTGAGYVARNPATGGGGYIIQGAIAPPTSGGSTVDRWDDFDLNCSGAILSGDIIQPAVDAPDPAGLFVAGDEPLDITLRATIECSGTGTTQMQDFVFTTSKTTEELGGGIFEIVFGSTVRTVAVIKVDLRIDSDNDGDVDKFDNTAEDILETPFLFWVNDDDNSKFDANVQRVNSPDWTLPGGGTLPQSEWNGSDEVINGVWDLMDFAPLHLVADSGSLDAIEQFGLEVILQSEGIRYFLSSDELTQGGFMGSESYWFDGTAASNQAVQYPADALTGVGINDGIPVTEVLVDLTVDKHWFVFEAVEANTTSNRYIEVMLEDAAGTNLFTLDRAPIDIQHMKDMYRSVNVRGSQSQLPYFTERLEDTGSVRVVVSDLYPQVPVADYGELMFDTGHVLVFIHGFANTENDAEAGFHNLWRKLYLTGYRSNLATYKWEGDEEVPGPNELGFDNDVQNALQSVRGLVSLIEELHLTGYTIDIAAHSLGNLLLLDSLRQLERDHPGVQYVRNVIHIEAAVWSTLYDGRPEDITEREVEQRSSWTHWAADIPVSIAGTIVNSYNAFDGALGAMVLNDVSGPLRDRYPDALCFPPLCSFEDWALGLPFRDPTELAFRIPRDPEIFSLSQPSPLGTGPITQTDFSNQVNFNNQDFLWPFTSHSGYREMPLYDISYWYRMVMINHIRP